MIKTGNVVICTDVEGCKALTYGKEYKILDIEIDNTQTFCNNKVLVKSDVGDECWYLAFRFDIKREDKINRILSEL